MPKIRKTVPEPSKRPVKPAITPEGRENQMISLAMKLAEQQLIDGTASAQVISHYLKLATVKEKLEQEKLRRENELLEAKAEAYKSAKRQEELFEEAIKAMRMYAGNGSDDDDD